MLSPLFSLAVIIRSVATISIVLTLTATANGAEPFDLKDGDRVVFLGDTLIEREQYHG